MQFQLEVYAADDHLGTVILHNRYAQALINGEAYPFKNVEDACVCLLALANKEAQRDRRNASGQA